MRTIVYNAAVAKLCGNNGIIKAVLINYIYNYHKLNIRKKPGDPVQITLAEFVYQYKHLNKTLWKKSCIHERLQDLIKGEHLSKPDQDGVPIYSVSPTIANLLNAPDAQLVSFDLGMACDYGIHVAIMARYLIHVIKLSPKGVAYNLSVKDMAEVNRLSPATIYRAIKFLKENEILAKAKPGVKRYSRDLALSLCNPGMTENV